jgi:hypothetical protein
MIALIIVLAGMSIIAFILCAVAILSDWSRKENEEKKKEK